MDYSSTGGMKSPFSPRVRQSISGRRPIGLSSSKKNQSKYAQSPQQESGDVIYKIGHSTIETYGMPLPVMVTEALTFASGDVSVRMSPCGWCWVVTGRRVLAWPQEATGSSSGPTAARELTLPQTDLAHKADLVMIFYEDNEQAMPSCVGVSPEGVVRYWASVGQEGAYSEITCELAGQECDRLVARTDESGATVGSLLLATTTCTLVRIHTSREGRPTVTCQMLRPPSGWLGGIGRRVSLLFFGSMPAHADTKLVGVVILPPLGSSEEDNSELVCMVAGGPLLQLWGGAGLHEHHLRRPLVDAFARAHLAPHGEPSTMEIMALDVHPIGDRMLLLLVVLVAAFNQSRPSDMRYALAQVSVEQPESPRVVALCGVAVRAGDEPPRCVPLAPLPPARALLYWPSALALVPADPSVSAEAVEHVELGAEGDRVLGACGAALFTRKHGLLRLRAPHHAHPPQSFSGSPMGSPCPSDMYEGNLTFYEIDPNELSDITTDAVGKLKLAFLLHVRRGGGGGGGGGGAARVLAELFPHRAAGDVDAPLDRTVLALATEMLDDVPAGDPRWRIRSGSSRVALGSSGALHAAGQLRDKQRAFTLFVHFLRAAGLFRRLAQVSKESGSGCVSTAQALGSLAARLAAARALQRLHQAGAPLVDAAMQHVVTRSEEEEPEVSEALAAGSLSAADVVLRRVTRVLRVCRALPALPAPHDARAAAQHAHHALHALTVRAHTHTHVVLRRVTRVLRVCRALPALPAPHDARAAAQHAHHALHALTTILNDMQKSVSQWMSWSEAEMAEGAGGAGGAGSGAGGAGPGSGEPCLLLSARSDLPALAKYHTHVVTQVAHNCGDATLRAQVLEGAASLADLLLAAAEPLAAHAPRVYQTLRRDLIQPYVTEGQLERAAALAEKFLELELLVDMCVRARRLDQLHAYLDKYEQQGISESAFGLLASGPGEWRALLLRSLGARRASSLGRWLRAAPARRELCALHALARAPHGDAAPVLLDMADDEESVDRMATMASLSKLCLYADDSVEPAESKPAWQRADELLALAAHHRALPAQLQHAAERRHAPQDLVQMYLDSDIKALTEYDYKKALDLTDFVEDPEVRDHLRLKIWSASILCEEWSGGGEEPQLCVQATMFYRLLDLLNLMGSDIEVLLPPLEQLLSLPELQDFARDPRKHYLLKYTYASLADDQHDQDQDQEQDM
ncbi:nuclear pore complex protein Nup133 [Colias croceus]|uniref:nuclear pore complex protein Nup133 n=1 Tax=Colias crocea TaxID=72248 RepID=UPI001E27D85A|nr:nuclear pore complex protein Nup133 [Colias croceus]